jgi:hypothetical protein
VIRVQLPHHLQTLARVGGEIRLEIDGPITLHAALDELERRYPMLRGTIRDHVTRERRPLIRFIAGQRDLTHDNYRLPLPDAVVTGAEPLMIIGAIAGG